MANRTGNGAPKRDFTLILLALVMGMAFAAMTIIPGNREVFIVPFLVAFLIAGIAYFLAIARNKRFKSSLKLIWSAAILFRLILLFTAPTLSDDAYRYLWDGHLSNAGVNPYAHPVNSASLDEFTTPLRELVNHDWMATPYLPAAQWLFQAIDRIAPQEVTAYQAAMLVFDLLTGWMIMKMLVGLKLPASNVLIYLWNPLIIVEFIHGAHVDAFMLFLMVLSLFLIYEAGQASKYNELLLYGSAGALALGTLTKALPILLVPVIFRHWGWKRVAFFTLLVAGISALFAFGAGWGLNGPLDGTGLFGAIRIYTAYWNYNSSIYHWLEVGLSGYSTPGAVPVEIVGSAPLRSARLISLALLAGCGILTAFVAWNSGNAVHKNSSNLGIIDLLRLSMLPLGTYLLVSPTIHPWYVTLVLPFTPFLFNTRDKHDQMLAYPWLYFSIAVGLSYLTYLTPDTPREYIFVRWVEFFPFYALLLGGILKKTGGVR